MGSQSIDVIPLWIDGKPTTSNTPTTFSVFSLAQDREVFKAQSADSEAATRAAEAAQNAFATWKDTPAIARRKLLLRVASEYTRRTQELIESQMLETSCTEAWATMNVEYAIKLLEEIACRITTVSGEIPPLENSKHMALVFKEPVGPMLTIAPWNAAVILATRAIAGQIAAGCTVVFKASELCPRTHHIISEAWHDSELPNGVLNVIQSRREEAAATTETLIAHPAIKKIEFIGSKVVGNIIGQLAAKYTKPILLELGGKSPAIVLDDANLEQAAELCVMGLSLHHGQICFSTERIYVQETVADKFLELLKSKQDSHDPGLPVTRKGLEQADSLVLAATKAGAKTVIGGPGPCSTQPSLKPTILTGVQKNMAIWDQETFGPSASLYTFSTDQEAIKLANNSEYGLNAAVHSTNMERAIHVARQLEVGQVHINNLTEYDEPTLPIGGTKASGWGRSNANWSLHEYTNLKTITVNMKELHTYI